VLVILILIINTVSNRLIKRMNKMRKT